MKIFAFSSSGWFASALCALLFCQMAAAAPREKLHVVYVTNRDRPPLPGYRERLQRIMADVHDFYRSEMERNGYGALTFRLDPDENRAMRVHLVTLDWDFDPARSFSPRELRPVIAESLKQKGIDIEQEYIITFENAYWLDGSTWKYDVVYTGSGDPLRGATWVADHALLDAANFDPALTDIIDDRGQKLTTGEFNVKMIGGVAHELGHGFGLPHNRESPAEKARLGTALMGSGNYTYRQERLGKKPLGSFLTSAHAFILSLHPLFNRRIPASFDVPDVFIDNMIFSIENSELQVTGQAVPAEEVAGIVFYHDPLPTGVNKDYDAFSYLAEMRSGGMFRVSMPLLKTTDGCALHLILYFKNGMHKKFSFTRNNAADNGLKSLRAGYLTAQVRHAFQQKDAERLRALIVPLEKISPEEGRGAQRFLKVAEQWQKFESPAKISPQRQAVALSATQWNKAGVGWYIPSFDGIMDPGGGWFTPLQSATAECPAGLYAHAPSSYTYTLDKRWKRLTTRIAIQRGHNEGSVIFIIRGDGRELFRSALIRTADGEVAAEVNLDGIVTLELLTETGADGASGDWGIWIAPTLQR